MERTAEGANADHVSGRSLANATSTGGSHHAHSNSSGSQQHQRHRSLSNRPNVKPVQSQSGSGVREQASTAKPPVAVTTNGASVARPQPAVFWNDKQSLEQSLRQQEQTFYDDVTPPPSPTHGGGSKNSLSIGYPSLKGPAPVGLHTVRSTGSREGGGGGYDYRWDHIAPPAPIPQSDRICGFKKKFFWIAVGVAIGLLLALAIGLGVGLSGRPDSNSRDSDPDGASTDLTPTSTNSEPASSVTTIRTATVTFTGTPETSEACPAANDTIFKVPNSPKTFRRFCGIDYRSGKGTTDLATVWTASMQDCMVNCAGFDGCTACAWGAQKGDNYRDNHRCYLKTDLGKSEEARDGWDFAILEK